MNCKNIRRISFQNGAGVQQEQKQSANKEANRDVHHSVLRQQRPQQEERRPDCTGELRYCFRIGQQFLHQRVADAGSKLPSGSRHSSQVLRQRESLQHRQNFAPVNHSRVPRDLLGVVTISRWSRRLSEERLRASGSLAEGHHYRKLADFRFAIVHSIAKGASADKELVRSAISDLLDFGKSTQQKSNYKNWLDKYF